ncbi:helix-turn-helix domain-containing protein [Variovorax sp. YR752]|uniref:helix-turn-helix domain-containing protein n=1 Tax=Variovorax sp. YR752 TaxID=1884383 RepID=UPI0031384177
MDSLIAAAGRALAAGDALSALKRVALRNDPPALALRGIAMAQLGELARSRELLRRAARGFGSHEALARARCVVAEAEVALALRELGGSPRTLAAAAQALEVRADHANATHARLIAVRRLLLLGRIGEAAAALAGLDIRSLASPSLVALAELAVAEVALRTLRTGPARAALQRAQAAAESARVPALLAEVAEAAAVLERPAARRWQAGECAMLRLAEVEALLASGALVVDACRRGLRSGNAWWPLGRRPVLFTLLRALAEGWPADVDRDALIARAFRIRRTDETHRARLRVEIGRLRALVAPVARIEASERGYALAPHGEEEVIVLVPPIEGGEASLQALLADGAAWSTSALALALGESQRTVQRALAELEAAGQVRAIGRARSQRWVAPPLAGFTTILLLPASLPLA